MKKAIGIDLGGTSIYGAVINEKGQILKKTERKTPSHQGKMEVIESIIKVIDQLWSSDILGIGIGSPGTIDSNQGKVLGVVANIEDWGDTDIRGEISKAYPDLPIYAENDANLAGLCEGWIGAGKDLESFVMLTLGTGVGGAVYSRKEGLLRGHKFQGGELGHAILYPKGRNCNCGQKGCVDKYISGSAIEERYLEKTGQKKRGQEIFKDVLTDNFAIEVMEEFCENLAIYMVSLNNIFDPQGLIIGGGVINSRDIWWEKMLDYYKIHSGPNRSMEIIPAVYLNDAGMIGAGRLVFINEEKSNR